MLVEVVLAAETHWWPEASWEALPRREVRGVPGPKAIAALAGRTTRELLEVFGGGETIQRDPRLTRLSQNAGVGAPPSGPEARSTVAYASQPTPPLRNT